MGLRRAARHPTAPHSHFVKPMLLAKAGSFSRSATVRLPSASNYAVSGNCCWRCWARGAFWWAPIRRSFGRVWWGLFFAVVVLGFILPHAATRNYWLQSALFAWLILVLYDFASTAHFNSHLPGERVVDVALGCAIALVATTAAFAPFFTPKARQTEA